MGGRNLNVESDCSWAVAVKVLKEGSEMGVSVETE